MRLSFAFGLFWMSVACCGIAQFLIVRSVRAHHDVRTEGTSVPRQNAGVELFWAVLPALALALLLVFTWRAVRETGAGAQPRVNGVMESTT